MLFPHDLVKGRFLAREKRFLIHVELDDGRRVIAHTNNTGAYERVAGRRCAGVAEPGRQSATEVEVDPGDRAGRGSGDAPWPGVNTALANVLVREAIASGLIGGLIDGTERRRPAAAGRGALRVRGPRAWTSCSATVPTPRRTSGSRSRTRPWWSMAPPPFPTHPTARGRKHLLELQEMVAGGERAAALVFCVQRGDAERVRPADEIDPEYGALLRKAATARRGTVRRAGAGQAGSASTRDRTGATVAGGC